MLSLEGLCMEILAKRWEITNIPTDIWMSYILIFYNRFLVKKILQILTVFIYKIKKWAQRIKTCNALNDELILRI